MTITIIAAMTKDRVIADSNKEGMLWHIPEELKHFRQKTINKTCIVGRKTAQQMPVLDGGRMGLVISSDESFYVNHPAYFTIPFKHLKLESIRTRKEELMVIGGAEIYKLFMPYADKIILSIVDVYVKGDKLFPEIDSDFEMVSTESRERFTVFTYIRRK